MKRYMYALVALITAVVGGTGCHNHHAYNLPPAERLMGPGPGVDGPGPGVMVVNEGIPVGGPFVEAINSQVAFIGPDGMVVNWDEFQPGMFDSEPLIVPGRQDFPQGAIYRLKLTNIPGRAGVELYPTLEVGPTTPRTDAFLAHNAIPVEFTPEDFDQVLTGNFVTKVIYLPDPEFQELALAGVETLVSTRLDPGMDPIAEADRRGAILGIVRIGNKDFQVPEADGIVIDGGVVQAGHQQGGQAPQGMKGKPLPVSYTGPCGPGTPYYGGAVAGGGANGPIPMGAPTAGFAPPAVPPNMIAGAPQWGMPHVGTPIGLPGPPHVPFGHPAGLKKHVMRNHTHQHYPLIPDKMTIDVAQHPGFSYPKPVSQVRVDEHIHVPPTNYSNPAWNGVECVTPNCQ